MFFWKGGHNMKINKSQIAKDIVLNAESFKQVLERFNAVDSKTLTGARKDDVYISLKLLEYSIKVALNKVTR